VSWLTLDEPVDAAVLLDELHQVRALHAARGPQLGRRHGVQRRPRGGIAGAAPPSIAEVAIDHTPHRGADPAGRVHAVGDVGDRHRIDVALGPQLAPHRPRDGAVTATDRVRRLAHPEAELRHAKRLGTVIRVDAAQADDRVGIDAEFSDHATEHADHLFGRVGLVAGGHRGVRGEDRPPSGRLERRDAHGPAPGGARRQLEHRECRVPLVKMHESRLDAHGLERA